MNEQQRRAIAFLRQVWPDKAAEIERLLTGSGDKTVNADMKIEIGVHYRLEKFDGEFSPEKKPVEVIEGDDIIA